MPPSFINVERYLENHHDNPTMALIREAYLALSPEERTCIDRQVELLVNSNLRSFGVMSALELLYKLGRFLAKNNWTGKAEHD